jgi:hypothetical protein
MRWTNDPDIALQSRVAFGPRTPYLTVMTIAGLTLALYVSSAPLDVAVGILSAILGGAILVALPFAAIHIAALDRDGRLDLHRLAGRSDAALGGALLIGSSWLLVAAGIPGVILVNWLGLGYLQIGALLMVSIASAAMLMAVPRATEADNGAVAAILVIATIAITGGMLAFPHIAMRVAALSAIVVIAAGPFAFRRLRRPAPPAARGAGVFRTRSRASRFPEFARALAASQRWWIVGLGVVVPALALSIVRRDYVASEQAELMSGLGGALLVAVGITASMWLRRERSLGGIDRICLSGQRRWSVVAQIAAAVVAPFLILAMACAAILATASPGHARLFVFWPPLAALMVGAGMVEALRGRRLGTYVIPLMFVTGMAAFGNHGATWWVPLTAVWIPLVMAAGVLERPDAAPISNRLLPLAAAAAGACLTATLLTESRFYFASSVILLAGFMSVIAGILLPDRMGSRVFRRVLIVSMTCGLAAGLTEYFGIGPQMRSFVATRLPADSLLQPLPFSILAGCLAGTGFAFGAVIHHRHAGTPNGSLGWRMIPLFGGFLIDKPLAVYLELGYRIQPARYNVILAEMTVGFTVILLVATLVVSMSVRRSN